MQSLKPEIYNPMVEDHVYEVWAVMPLTLFIWETDAPQSICKLQASGKATNLLAKEVDITWTVCQIVAIEWTMNSVLARIALPTFSSTTAPSDGSMRCLSISICSSRWSRRLERRRSFISSISETSASFWLFFMYLSKEVRAICGNYHLERTTLS